MSQFRPFTVMLYWGGQQIYMPGVGTLYYPNISSGKLKMTEKLTYREFVERICVIADVDTTIFKLNITFRLPTYMGMYMAMKVVKDSDLEDMYDLAERMENYYAEMYLDNELLCPTMQQNQDSSVSLFPALQHFDQGPSLPIGGSSFPSQSDYRHPPVEPTPLVSCVGLSNTGRGKSLMYNDSRVTNIVEIDEDDGVIGIEKIRLELEADNQFVDRGETSDESTSPPSSEDESLGYEDIGDDSDTDNDCVTGNVDVRDTRKPSELYIPAAYEFFNDIGDVDENDPFSREDIERIHIWDEDNRQIRLGLRFVDKKQLKRAITMWSIEQNREYKVWESKKMTWVAKCKTWCEEQGTSANSRTSMSCLWSVRARKRCTHGMWEITKLVAEHNCSGGSQTNDHCNLTSPMIAIHIKHSIQSDPSYAVKSLQADIKNDLGVDISYKKAWHARRRAIELIYGSWEYSFAVLPKFMEALKMSNPGTVVEWLHHPRSSDNVKIFKYVFWAFRPAIEAFHKCRPVISVDGTHLRGSYKGKLLVAVTHDANNGLLPLAFAIVDEETSESWSWFMQQIRHNVAFDRNPLCVLSDRHRGLLHAMTHLDDWNEPWAYHRFCLRHVRSNFNMRFKNLKLKRLVWGLGCAHQKQKWRRYMNEVKAANSDAWEYLSTIDRKQWCLAYDGNYRWGHLTTNVSESYNNVLRGARQLPIQACVDSIFHRTVKLFVDRLTVAQHCQFPLPKKIWNKFKKDDDTAKGHTVQQFDLDLEVYKVTTKVRLNGSGGHVHKVKYLQKACSCGKWQMYRLPCSHAIAVCRKKRHDPLGFFSSFYHVSTFVDQYSGHFSPLSHPDNWPHPGWELKMDDDRFISHRQGRVRASRIQGEQDRRLPDEPARCSRCHLPGHNRTTCL